MKRLTDPTFVYHNEASHADSRAFHARMKLYAKMVAKAKPASNVKQIKRRVA